MDEAAFFARLSRSRGASNKVQYLRIQALHLQEADMPSQALTLLKRAQTDYPEAPGQVSGILMQEAECCWAVNDPVSSIEAYIRALAAQRHYPNVVHAIALSFAQRFYRHDSGCYAAMLLDAIHEELKRWSGLEPYMKVRYAVAMVRLHEQLNEKSDAAQCARIALENLPQCPREVDDDTRAWLINVNKFGQGETPKTKSD